MDAVTATPTAAQRAGARLRPGQPERASLQAALAELAGAHHELTGDHRRPRSTCRPAPRVRRGRPARPRARARHHGQRDPRGRQGGGRGRAAGRAGAGAPCRSTSGRPSCCARPTCSPARGATRSTPPPCWASPRPATRPRSTPPASWPTSGGSTSHFGRQILAEPAGQRPGHVEPDGPPAAGGLRLRDHPVQLHRHRRQPAHRARADGQHGGLEAVADPDAGRAPHHAAAGGGRAAAGRDQHAHRRRAGRLRGAARRPGAGRHPLHRLHGDVPAPVVARSAPTSPATRATRGWSARPAARTSCSPTPAPTSTCCAPRWSAARSSTRARSARRRPGRTCRGRCGPGCATSWPPRSTRCRWATSPTSATSAAR